MSLSIVFIHKKTLRVVEALPWPVEGGVTTNHGTEFYVILTDIVGEVGADWSEIINSQLPKLRALYPDVEHKDDDGNNWIERGRYSEQGFCSQPYDMIKEGDLWH